MDKFDKSDDSQLKNVFENESKPFDQDAMWSTLERALDRKKNRRWVFFLSMGLFGLAILISFQIFSVVDSLEVATVITDEKTAPTLIDDSQILSSRSADTDNNTSDISARSQIILDAGLNQEAHPILDDKQTFRGEDDRHKKIIFSRKKKENKYSPKPILNIEKTINRNSIRLTKNYSENVELINESVEIINTNEGLEAMNFLGKKFTPLTLQPISSRGIESILSYSLVTPAVSISDNDWSLCRISLPWSWYLEGHGGYSLPTVSNTTRIKDEPLSESYLSEWDAVQSVVGGYQGGIQAIAQSPSGIEFGLGLEYIKVIKKLSTSQRIIERISIYDPMAYFYRDSINNIIWVGDTVSQTVITDQTKTTRQSHSLWNIPIRIGYMHHIGDWNFGIHSGVVFNLRHTFEGTILRKDGSFVVLGSNNQESVYKKSLGVSFLGDLYLGRQLNDAIEIFVKPEFRYYPKEWTTAAHSLTSQVHLSQVQLGVRYRIK